MHAASIPSSFPFTFFLSPYFPGVFPFLSSLRSLAVRLLAGGSAVGFVFHGAVQLPCVLALCSAPLRSPRAGSVVPACQWENIAYYYCLLSPPAPWALAAGTRRALLTNE